MRLSIAFLVMTSVVGLSMGCRTTVTARPVSGDQPRMGGIPFFAPKALLLVSEPIEVGRKEELFALIEAAGVQQYLFALTTNSPANGASALRQLLNLPADTQLVYVASPGAATAQTEVSKKSETQTTEHSKRLDEETSKYTLIPAPPSVDVSSAPLYKGAEIGKSYMVQLVPDLSREYELLIAPALFASSKIDVTLSDGWRLTSLNTESGENQMVGAHKDLAAAVLGAQKEVRLAEIGREQALELARLTNKEAIPAAVGTAQNQPEDRKFHALLRVVGYVKKVTITTVTPGIYDLDGIVNESKKFQKLESVFWQRVSF